MGAQRWFVKWIETEKTSEGEIVERVSTKGKFCKSCYDRARRAPR